MEKTITENEHPLVTPNFIGTDDEKINVLGYWSNLITLLRSLNGTVISYDNKLAIINQLKTELEILDHEVVNVTAHAMTQPDGSTEMSTMPKKGEEAAAAAVTVTSTSPTDPQETVGQSPEVDLTPKNESKRYDFEPESSTFKVRDVPTAEAMQRLAGIWYKPPKKK